MAAPVFIARDAGANAIGARRRAITAPLSELADWFLPALTDAARLRPRADTPASAARPELQGVLAQFERGLRRAWYLAAVRRALLGGLIAALAAAAVAALLHWPAPVGPLAGLAVTVGFLVHAWGMAPGLMSTARFLDRELRLQEQLATALELETASTRASTALGSRAQRVAADAGQAAANAWRAGPVVAGREWAALAVLLLALSTLVTHQPRQVVRQNLVASSGQSTVLVPTLPPAALSGVSNSRSISVRVAVVSAQDRSSSPLKAAPAAGARSRPATARAAASHADAHGAPPASAASTSSKIGGGKVSGTTNGHAVPLKFNQSFLPTLPSGAAKKGGLLTGSKAPANGAKAGNGNAAKSGTSSSATAPSRTAKGGAAGPASSAAAAQHGGKAGSAGAKTATQCLYGCRSITKSQITAPGLIVGKGQFSGQSAPGGKTSGHGAGAAPRLGSAKTPAPTAGHQLSITSGYGPTHAKRLPATQARGHNGPGGSGQAGVSAGAASSQTLDYVPPDANATNPGDAGVVIRYFTPSSAP